MEAMLDGTPDVAPATELPPLDEEGSAHPGAVTAPARKPVDDDLAALEAMFGLEGPAAPAPQGKIHRVDPKIRKLTQKFD
jgi:hypothetical protein